MSKESKKEHWCLKHFIFEDDHIEELGIYEREGYCSMCRKRITLFYGFSHAIDADTLEDIR